MFSHRLAPGETFYQAFAEHLVTRGKPADRKVLTKQLSIERRESALVIRYQQTDIVTLPKSGGMILNSGGWRTQTTRKHIGSVLPKGIWLWSEKGIWLIGATKFNGNGPFYSFQDGMTIREDKTIEGALDALQAKRQTEHAKAVPKYVKAYMDAFLAGEVPAPSAGDCWFCLMVAKEGQSLGDAFAEEITAQGIKIQRSECNDHLVGHMSKDERYYVPSMLYNALKEKFGDGLQKMPAMGRQILSHVWTAPDAETRVRAVHHWEGYIRRTFGGALSDYLKKRFGLAYNGNRGESGESVHW